MRFLDMRRSLFTVCLLALALPVLAEVRTWTSIRGATVEAEFVELEIDTVVLRSAAGELLDIRLNQLSDGDQQYVRSLPHVQPSNAAQAANDVAPGLFQQTEILLQAELFFISQRDAMLLASILDRDKHNAWSLSDSEASQDALKQFAAIPSKRRVGSINLNTPTGIETRRPNEDFGDLIVSFNYAPTLGPDNTAYSLSFAVDARDRNENVIGRSASQIVMSAPGQKYLILPTAAGPENRQRRDSIVVLLTYK